MNPRELEIALKDCGLGGIKYFPSIGSTNDEALAWAAGNAGDLSLVLADAQSSGRGRNGRTWLSQPEASLTFSLILKPNSGSSADVARYTFLGALALTRLLTARYNLPAQIKWPNDVLVDGRKVCGILAEAVWTGADVDSVVLGMGVNLLRNAYPAEIPLNFPASSLQEFLTNPPSRLVLLRDLLIEIQSLRALVTKPAFLDLVRGHLAFVDRTVMLVTEGERAHRVIIKGLEADGSLLVKVEDGGFDRVIHQGEVHLLPD